MNIMSGGCGENCENAEIVRQVEFVFEGVGVPLVGVLGLLGNIIAILVLRQPEMRSNFNQLLVWLAVIDVIYILIGIWDYSLVKVFNFHFTFYVYLFPYIWYPFKNILMSWTTFLTMALATERYLAVCRPILYRSLEVTYSSKVRVMTYVLPTFAGSVILNIPKFLEAKHVHTWERDEVNNLRNVLTYNVTSLRLDPNYMYYYIHWTRLLTTGIIPFSYLVIINLKIYRRMRQNNLSTVRSRSLSMKKAGNLAAILIVIVVMFLISNTPRLVLNLTEYSVHSPDNDGLSELCGCNKTPTWFSATISINHFLLTVNSSINFLIYCSIGDKFILVVKKIFSKSDENLIENMTDTFNSDYTKRNKEVSAITEETTLTMDGLGGKLFQSKTNICQM